MFIHLKEFYQMWEHISYLYLFSFFWTVLRFTYLPFMFVNILFLHLFISKISTHTFITVTNIEWPLHYTKALCRFILLTLRLFYWNISNLSWGLAYILSFENPYMSTMYFDHIYLSVTPFPTTSGAL